MSDIVNDEGVIDGTDYFAPVDNGDATPVGDVDSEADLTPSDDTPPVAGDDAVTDDDAGDADEVDPVVESEWLEGFEGRFRKGEEAKALAAYTNLEREFSQRDEEMKKLLAEERQAAFEQAALLAKANQPDTPHKFIIDQNNRRELVQHALYDPEEAFNAACELGDEKAIEAVIKAIRVGHEEYGIGGNPDLADRYDRQLMDARVTAAVQEQQHQIAQLTAQHNMSQATNIIQSQYADLMADDNFQRELAVIAEAEKNSLDVSSSQSIVSFFEACAERALGRMARNGLLPQVQEDAPANQGEVVAPVVDTTASGVVAQRKQSMVPSSSTPRVTSNAKLSEADEYAQELLRIADAERPKF